MIAGASLNPVRWLAGVIRCRFDFDRQVAMRLAEHLGASPAETLSAAATGANAGAESTANMVARVGRASRLGERSRGSVDAGARSFAVALSAIAQAYTTGDPA